ncbi:Putrescine transport system permease protein PotH (TC 3.A.1.11.2) [Citrobacter freundii]|uniref:Putrescine transport system permease protein PotH (TC 3.A.1.11.2) n=1 Tax=Citrobacter freundii TaxID=546 RepID=A0A7G2IJQ6_CITFR|nr:Putrescine transport system permease protein PotH (TC 3.A.1.11.2) [Citrobacter freundii]
MSTLEPPARVDKAGRFTLFMSRLQMKHGRKLVIALPYVWLLLLFLLPFLIVFKISLAEMARAIPPYTDLVSWADDQLSITLNLANFLQLTDDPLYFDAYLQSLQVAGISTICCLLLGYPLAWAVAHSKPSTRNILLLLVILPSWTSFLIRVYAWMGILKKQRRPEQLSDVAGCHRPTVDYFAHQSGGLYRHCLRLFALYGAADLYRADPY